MFESIGGFLNEIQDRVSQSIQPEAATASVGIGTTGDTRSKLFSPDCARITPQYSRMKIGDPCPRRREHLWQLEHGR